MVIIKWQLLHFQILQFQRVIFELEYYHSEDSENDIDSGIEITIDRTVSAYETVEKPARHRILLRGQMKYIDEWDMIAFLCTPL